MLETSEISVALQWATEIFGFTNVPKYYISPQNFLTAYRDGDSYSFVVKDDQFYEHAPDLSVRPGSDEEIFWGAESI